MNNRFDEYQLFAVRRVCTELISDMALIDISRSFRISFCSGCYLKYRYLIKTIAGNQKAHAGFKTAFGLFIDGIGAAKECER